MLRRINNRFFWLLVVVVSIMTFESCVDTCDEPVYPAIVTELYVDSTKVKAVNNQIVDFEGLSTDSLVSSIGGVYLLPFVLTSDTTKYKVSVGEVSDTLIFVYKPWLEYINEECGCVIVATLENVGYTTNIVKSVDIVSSNIGKAYTSELKSNEPNIHIHF